MTTRATCGKRAVNFMARKVATEAVPVNPHFWRPETRRGKPQPNTRFEQEATEETERWTMSSDALFSLFSPVQNMARQRNNCPFFTCD
jgi:hypothetical protein